jgi:hypothetical protein
MQDQNKQIFFSFKNIAKKSFWQNRSEQGPLTLLWTHHIWDKRITVPTEKAAQVEGSRPTGASKRTEGRTSVKSSSIVDEERIEVATK